MSFTQRWWRGLRQAWTQGLRQQITRSGVAYSAALALVALAAFLSANNLMFLILAAMLSTLLLSGFISRLGLAGLELNLMLPEHISARRKVRAGIRLKNLKSWIPSFSIHLAGAAESGFDSILYFPVIPGGALLEESVELYFARRGTQRERSFQFSTRFPFGFAERREMVTAQHDILVYPCLDPQPGFEALLAAVSGEMEAQQRGRGHDFYRIRPYEALESARHVDWKATAHTGDLQVREFAREQDHRVEIYLDLEASGAPEAWFESAIDCAAFLAFRLSESGAHVRLRTQEYDATSPGEASIYSILKYLALVSPMRGKPPAGPDDPASFHIVFTPDPERMAALGWGAGESRGCRLLGLDALTRTESS
jgi:uncharacterized protein (DUF58 family)